MKSRHIYSGLDMFKVFAAIGVVAIHTQTMLINTIGRLGVPFFAIVSSFLFFSKYRLLSGEKEFNYLVHFEKRIGLLFLCWQILYLPSALLYLRQKLIRFGTRNGIINFIAHFVFPPFPLTDGWGQSWYLIGMLIGIPLFILMKKVLGEFIVMLLCVLLTFFYVDYNTYWYLWDCRKFLPHGLVYFLGSIGNNSFPILIIFIGLGWVMSKKASLISKISIKSITLISLLALFIYFIENIYVFMRIGKADSTMVIMTVPTSLLLVIWGLKLPISLKNELFWRRFSTFLYCIHVGIIHCFDVFRIVWQLNLNSFIIFVSTLFISYLFYIVFNYLIERRKMIWLNNFV